MRTRNAASFAWCVAVLAVLTFPRPARSAEREDLGAPLKTVAVYNGGYGTLPDGKPIVAFTVKGSPGVFTVLDASTREPIFTAPMPGADDGSWAVEVARNGTVYIGGTAGGLFSWRAGEPAIRKLAQLDKVILSVREAPDGRIYIGTFPTGRLFRYDPATGKTEDLGAVVEGEQYASSLAFDGDTLYIGVGAHPNLIRYDTRTGHKTRVNLPAEVTEGGASVSALAIAGRRLFGIAGKGEAFAWDLDAGKIAKRLPAVLAQGAVAAPARNGKTYIPVKPGGLLEYDLATDTTRPAPNFRATSFTRDFGWLTLNGRERLLTVSWGGQIWAYDPETGQESLPVKLEGQPVSVQAMQKGPDGRIYLSGYPGGVAARIDPQTGKTETFSLGQAEGFGAYGKTLYMGIYPQAAIWKMEADGPLKPAKAFDIGAEQDRPFAFAAGRGKVYIGTVPGYGLLGGALTVYDPKSGQHTAYRNIVPDQSIIGLAWHQGLLYGSTSIWGGLGQSPRAEAAVVFAWDPITGRTVRSAIPTHKDLAEAPKAINGLAFAPDGRLWISWQGTVARLNPRTLAVEAVRSIRASNWDVTHSWQPQALRFAQDGTLYAVLAGSLYRVDPETLESRDLGPAGHAVMGDDGALYVSHARHIYRLHDK